MFDPYEKVVSARRVRDKLKCRKWWSVFRIHDSLTGSLSQDHVKETGFANGPFQEQHQDELFFPSPTFISIKIIFCGETHITMLVFSIKFVPQHLSWDFCTTRQGPSFTYSLIL